ncbi:alkaline phosphatase [Pseudomethylobacillus aquaticus]|uniref:Alkaline phosphatase n=1 Tax=Pseudomethylobacillus aquaticus TaxID=2676064 RepID=A0A3N0V6F8_9PROT|nr:choice-of-anchor I family protein [Pseudomethylobacillus aquaticus]ROH88376.1 alkaline phosphatase [Pseudomethylobacillus aquaticus]
MATAISNSFIDARFDVLDSIALSGAEISAYDAASQKFFVTTPGNGLLIVDASDPANLILEKTLDLTAEPFSFVNGVNSVAVKNGIIAIAVENSPKTEPGKVLLINADGQLLNSITVGAQPDMLTFSPDGSKILVANEAERSAPNGAIDPEGSISIIDLSGGVAQASVQTADFTAFNGTEDALREAGVRIFHGKTVSQDVEPEYIAVSPDGKTAMITLQEANAVAILDIATAKITEIVPLGLKSYEGMKYDFSDRDSSTGGNAYVPTSNKPVFGMYMPDAIAAFSTAGKTYYAIANEGDDRDDFITGGEKARLSSLKLDPEKFPDAAALQSNSSLGRLNTPDPDQVGQWISGDTDGDGDIDQILAYGGRSFSILDSTGKVVFDSGDHIERYMASQGNFSSGGTFDDSRSDDKGPEPEGVTIATIAGRSFAIVGVERGGGGAMIYDVTNVDRVQFVTYVRNLGDISPEGLTYVSASDSPTGQALLALTNEVSNTLTVFGLTRILQGTDRSERLASGEGVDELTGGGAKDVFIFGDVTQIGTRAGARDVVTDFTSGLDHLDFRKIDANVLARGNQKFVMAEAFEVGVAGRLVATQVGEDTLLSGDVNGDGQADFTIELLGVSKLENVDILF